MVFYILVLQFHIIFITLFISSNNWLFSSRWFNTVNTENVPFTRNHYYGTGFCKARGHTVTDECPKGTSHVTEWRVLCRTSSVIMISCKRHSQIHSNKLGLSYVYFTSIWLKIFAKFQSFLIKIKTCQTVVW